MTKAIAETYNTFHENRIRISLVLMAASIVMAMLYIINVYSVISHTVAIQKMNSQIAITERTVEGLDSKYLALSSKITPDSLGSYGMSQGKVTEYIAKNVGGVAMRGHEF